MYKLEPLSYSYDALEPVICSEIMQLHYDKHLNGYATNYNNAIKDTKWDNMDLKDVLANLDQLDNNIKNTVRNNGGGVANHVSFFASLKPGVELKDSPLKEQIIKDFGSVENFLEEFKQKATTLFGSGWAWLVLDNNKLAIKQYHNQDNPYMDNLIPLLGIDVWEHAYYIQYKNVRADYVNNIFTIIDWDVVNNRFEEACK